ncbi:MAG: cobyrinate a,c-diamide synthase [Clostridiaceae bacterium]|nr:cobyrinate a,c-diamide synthase [Clostridiaceae bacterium]
MAGTQSGVGKTTISLGIMGALKKRGLKVKPFKVGPDYIDPQFHRYVTDETSRNLDSYLLQEETLRTLFYKNAKAGDIAVVEGVMGLYDGLGTKKDEGSSAHIAKLLNLPVLLVINGGGMSSSAAAMVLGYKMYDPDVNIKGIIINNVSGEGHYAILKEAIERDIGIKCVGYLKKNKDIQLKSRHLGLIPCGEVGELKDKVEEVIAMVEETIDLDTILQLAGEVKLKEKFSPSTKVIEEKATIAYAYDDAFNFYYQDNLDLLKELGCNIIPFSPLKDKELPKGIHGIYIGGGFPEVFAEELQENGEIRQAIYNKAKEGLPIYAECGGFMYLTKEIKDLQGNNYEMVGVFEAQAEMTERLQRFGYCEVETKEDSSFFQETLSIKAHEFHRAVVINKNQAYSYNVTKKRNGEVVSSWNCGIEKYNCLGAFPHIHFYSNRDFAKNFIQKCSNYRKKTNE